MLLIPFVLLLQALGPAPQVADPGAVWGTVRDGTAGRALAAGSRSPNGRAAALTDSAGRYRLDGLRPGPHQLRFVREGYDTLAIGVLVPDSAPRASTWSWSPTRSACHAAGGRRAGGPDPDQRLARQRRAGTRAAGRRLARPPAGRRRRRAPRPGRRAGRAGGGARRSGGLHVRGGGRRQPGPARRHPAVFGGPLRRRQQRDQPRPRGRRRPPYRGEPGPFGEHLAGVVELETRDPGPEPFAARGAFGRSKSARASPATFPRSAPASRSRRAPPTAARSPARATAATPHGSGYGDLLGVATSDAGRRAAPGPLLPLQQPARLPRLRRHRPATGGAARTPTSRTTTSGGTAGARAPPGAGAAGASSSQTAAWAAGSSAEIAWRGAEGPERLRSRWRKLACPARAAWPGASAAPASAPRWSVPNHDYAVTGAGGLSLLARRWSARCTPSDSGARHPRCSSPPDSGPAAISPAGPGSSPASPRCWSRTLAPGSASARGGAIRCCSRW